MLLRVRKAQLAREEATRAAKLAAIAEELKKEQEESEWKLVWEDELPHELRPESAGEVAP